MNPLGSTRMNHRLQSWSLLSVLSVAPVLPKGIELDSIESLGQWRNLSAMRNEKYVNKY